MNKKVFKYLVLFTLLWNCERGPKLNDNDLLKKSTSLLGTKVTVQDINQAEASLGEALFNDVNLSGNSTQSCNTCHNVRNYGVDNEVTSLGAFGQRGSRNTPTVYNALYSVSQFWDGRASNLEEQALGPILNRKEMGSTKENVERYLRSEAYYVENFKKVYGVAPSLSNVAKAIASYERTLFSRGTSRYDKFLSGDTSALNKKEKRGLEHFLNYGCVGCHSGNNLGGRSYAKFGVLHPYSNTSDTGRYELTKQEYDRYVFKVPSLRNVAQTSPYFHDGGERTLQGAVKTMAYVQLGRELSEDEVSELVAFLSSTTD